MGKYIVPIATIGVSIAAAAFAPALSAALVSTLHVSAIAASAIVAAGTLAAVAAVGAIATALVGPPRARATAPPLPSQAQLVVQDGWVRRWPDLPSQEVMEPVDVAGWPNRHFYPGQRFAAVRLQGDCLRPIVRDGGGWAIIDRQAFIRRGDLMIYGIADWRSAYGFLDRRHRPSGGLGKRFVGIDASRNALITEATFPPGRLETGTEQIEWAYRVRGIAYSAFGAFRLWSSIRRDPEGYDARLGGEILPQRL